jgi:hypothetical protein
VRPEAYVLSSSGLEVIKVIGDDILIKGMISDKAIEETRKSRFRLKKVSFFKNIQ